MFAIRIGRVGYALALLVYGVQQFIFGDFRPVFFPPWQSLLPLQSMWAYAFGGGLVVAAGGILLEKNGKEIFLILGTVFLGIVCFAHIPYQFISQPNRLYHLGIWAEVLKELALAGGAFVMAGSYRKGSEDNVSRWRFLDWLIPYGSIFYSITIICFGVAHCLYADGISRMVPEWIPDHMFWTYFAAVALIGSGTAIVLNVRRKFVAILQSVMIFLWFLIVHMPSALTNPMVDRGNLLASAFDALLFSATALIIAFGMSYQAGDSIV